MAFSGSLTATTLSSSGNITKGLDGDNSVTLAHGLPSEPDMILLTAKSGTEAGWRISAKDATNITLVCSSAGGTGGSIVSLVSMVLHSLIK